jgi:predicted alpha/beta-fold hydrolase
VSSAEFRPPRWLGGPHAQTILPWLLPARPVGAEVSILDVPVAAASTVRVLLTRPRSTPRGTLVAIHGLCGSSESGYMRRTASEAHLRGWAVARINLRNCGGTETLSDSFYNAGQSGDADAVLAAIEAEALPRPFALLGFSLGGNIALLYAGRSGDACRADTVVGVNPPVDLSVCIDALERRANALYHAYFTRSLCAQLRSIRRVRAVPGPDARPGIVGGVRGFDHLFTAPDAGYASASEYYCGASAAAVLSGIRRRAMILSAQDDPFVPVSMFDAHRAASTLLAFAHPPRGGHCGYWGTTPPRYWAADAALTFFEGDGVHGI